MGAILVATLQSVRSSRGWTSAPNVGNLVLLPHLARTWILNPSCALMRARVGYKIRFDQPIHLSNRLLDFSYSKCQLSLGYLAFQCSVVFPPQLFPPSTKYVRCPTLSIMCIVPTPKYMLFPTLIIPPIKKVCAVSLPPITWFFCVVPYPPQCSYVPLPHLALSWILSEDEPNTDTWAQLNFRSSSTCISECGTSSWACFEMFCHKG